MSLGAVIARNIFSNWVGVAVEALLGFVLAPFIIRQVGDTGYGIWVLIIAFSGYFGLLNLGLRPAINKYVAQYNALHDYAKLNAMVNTGLMFYTGAAALVILVSAGAAWIVPVLFNVPGSHSADARTVTILVGVQVALSLPGVVLGGILSGLQRYDIHCAIGSLTSILRAGLLLAFLRTWPSIVVLAASNLAAAAVAQLLTILAVRRVYPHFRFQFRLPERAMAGLLFRYSGVAMLIHVASRVINYGNAFIIALFLPIAAVTPYAIAGKFLELSRDLVSETTNVFSPAASHLQAARDLGRLQSMLDYTTKILVLLLVPVTFGFVFLGRPFIELWMGPGYGLSADILTVLAVSQLFSLPQQGLRAILYGIGEHRFLAYTTALEGALNLLLSIILVSRYGPLGVAWAAAIPAVLVGMLGLPRIGCRLLKMPLGPHLARAYGRPLATSVAFVGCLLVTTSLIPPTTWGSLILDAAISSLAHLAVSGIFVLGTDDRQAVWRLVRQAAGRLPVVQPTGPATRAPDAPAAPEGLR